MWLLAFIGALASALSVVLVLIRHRRLNDWRLWMIPVALSLLATAQLQGLVGPDRGLGRLADIGWLRPLGAFLAGLAALLIVSILERLIDERERVRESVHMREQWVRMLTTSLPALMWTTNRKGTVTSHTGGGHRRLGIRPNQYLGSTITSYFGDENTAAPVWSALRHALSGESIALELDWQGHRYDGFLEPLYDERNGVVGTMGFLLDRSDDAAGVVSASEHGALLSMIAQQLPAVIWVTDVRSQITYAAGAGLAALGLEAGDLVGASAQQFIANTAPSDVGMDAYERAMKGESVGYRALFGGHSGDCFLAPLRADDGRVAGVLGIAMASDVEPHLTGPIDRACADSRN